MIAGRVRPNRLAIRLALMEHIRDMKGPGAMASPVRSAL
jgi:hypothetical protein